ncbi:hypothetical protein EJ04DRAFT_445409, partial [Polyplosphaeria fusca]
SSRFAGSSHHLVDEAWQQLLASIDIRVTQQELQRNNRTSVSLPGGGYLAWLGIDHCLDRMRAMFMCHPDISSLVTFLWEEGSKPTVDGTKTLHECVDWDALMASIKGRGVSPDEMSALENPSSKEVT